jgi:hypothetical protein
VGETEDVPKLRGAWSELENEYLLKLIRRRTVPEGKILHGNIKFLATITRYTAPPTTSHRTTILDANDHNATKLKPSLGE